jgi:hypothetical protein
MARRPPPDRIIGWREWVALPDLGVDRIRAKIDTGAKTSALHAHRLRTTEDVASFEIHPVQRKATPSIPTELPIVDWREIRSSNGQVQRRPVVSTTITAGDLSWEIELTLTSRDAMGFRMLLGRRAIHGRFLVDVARSHVLGQP